MIGAVRDGRIDNVKGLIKELANINAVDENGVILCYTRL